MILKPVHAVGCLLAVALTGCASPDSEAASVDRVAEQFVSAVQQKDGDAACKLLSPSAEESLTSSGDACDTAVLDVKTAGSPHRTQVWGDEAQVRTGSDVIFLMHLKKGWRIRAAGCSPQQDRPYSCDVEA